MINPADPRSPPALPPRSMSLSHPNVCQSFKACLVQVLPDAGGVDGVGIAAGSAAASPTSDAPSGAARVVRSLTDRNALVRVMEPGALLEPG